MMLRAWNRNGTTAAAKARMSAKATSASSRVKPPSRTFKSGLNDRDPARVPIDADLIAHTLARDPERRPGGGAVRLEAHDQPASAHRRVGPDQVERDIKRNRHRLSTLAEERAPIPVDEDLPLAPRERGTEPLSAQKIGRLE